MIDIRKNYHRTAPYRAFVEASDEKPCLRAAIRAAVVRGDFPFSLADTQARILDFDCGLGINTQFLAQLFPVAHVVAMDCSSAQIRSARPRLRRYPNVTLHMGAFQELLLGPHGFDFILMSHVLQYVDVRVDNLLLEVVGSLRLGGELWIVQQTDEGVAEIIRHMLPLLLDYPRFVGWRTFRDFLGLAHRTLPFTYQVQRPHYLESSIRQIDFVNPSAHDKLRLEFIFCLETSFDEQSEEFKRHLATLKLGDGQRIRNPNGILRIRRVV